MINQKGKKYYEWQAEKRKRIQELKSDPRYTVIGEKVFGICPDCGHFHQLTPDHKTKRSQGGGHEASNLDWVCNATGCWCHTKRDNWSDDMTNKPEVKKSKKPDWAKPHACKQCKRETSTLLCSHCKRMSI